MCHCWIRSRMLLIQHVNESLAISPRRRRKILIGKNERLSFINNYYAELAGTTNVQIYFSFSRDFSRVLESLCLFLSHSFSFSFSHSADRIDIRARMRLRASSTSSFTWLPQERRPTESISHTDISTSSSSLSLWAPRTLRRSFSLSDNDSKSDGAKQNLWISN